MFVYVACLFDADRAAHPVFVVRNVTNTHCLNLYVYQKNVSVGFGQRWLQRLDLVALTRPNSLSLHTVIAERLGTDIVLRLRLQLGFHLVSQLASMTFALKKENAGEKTRKVSYFHPHTHDAIRAAADHHRYNSDNCMQMTGMSLQLSEFLSLNKHGIRTCVFCFCWFLLSKCKEGFNHKNNSHQQQNIDHSF